MVFLMLFFTVIGSWLMNKQLVTMAEIIADDESVISQEN